MTINLEGAEVRPIEADAYAVLLPATVSVQMDEWMGDFLRRGGRALVVTPRAEKTINAVAVQQLCSAVTATAHAAVIVAADADGSGAQGFDHLLPTTPTGEHAATLTDDELADNFTHFAVAARTLGVSMILGPVLDMVTGSNPWLRGRLLTDDYTRTATTGAVYVQSLKSVGIMAAAKYFPGHSDLPRHPARTRSTLTVDQNEVLENLAPFHHLVGQGIGAMVLGPVTATAIDPDSPAATSKLLVDLLRRELGFRGLIISDHLTSPSTTLGRDLAEVARAAIAAGVQLLRIPGGTEVGEIASALAQSVHDGRLSRSRLARAADAVRDTAAALGRQPSMPVA